jgi:predicted GNAT family N-acyltransferase
MQVIKVNSAYSTLLKFSNHLGNVGSVSLTKNKGVGFINNILVYPHLRKQGYGSKLLKESELFLKKEYQVNRVSLVAWQKEFDPLTEFYKKNGYCEDSESIFYDDGVMEHELVPMTKDV